MNTQNDIKMTDQLERDLIDRELGTQRAGLIEDFKAAVATVQTIFGRLQADARAAKIAFANG